MNRIEILGIRIDRVDYAETLTQVENYLREGASHQIATVNPEFIVLAQSNAEFKRVLNSTALNVPDGVGLLWAARWLGRPIAERVTGQELVDRVGALAARDGRPVFFLGAREGVAEQAAAELVRRHPGLVIAGCHAGSPGPEQDDESVARIRQTRAQILFVAYGPPNQELWIARNATRLPVALAIGVGGTFDTLAGHVPRAPRWMREAGLEWMYRLLREPRRLKRQLTIPYFMWLVVTCGIKRPSSE